MSDEEAEQPKTDAGVACPWDRVDDAILRLSGDLPPTVLAARLGRSPAAVLRRLAELDADEGQSRP